MMILAYLTLLLTQATEGVFNVPFPQGRYIGGISHPHLRIVTIFVTLDEVQKVNLSVTCGYSSVSWSGCFDVVPKHGASDSFELEGYRTPRSVFFPEYMDLLDFFDSNCDRAPTLIGDLAVYSKVPNEDRYFTNLASDTIPLYPSPLNSSTYVCK